MVLTRKNMITSTNLILTWLAVADLMTMLSYLPISIHFYIMGDPSLPFSATKEYLWAVFMIFHANFSVVCHTIAIWLTIALAIFRYFYICFPIKGKEWCSIWRAKIAIACVYISTALVCTTNYLATKIAQDEMTVVKNSSSNYTVKYFVIKQIDNETFLKVNYWVQSIIVKLIPCVLLTILTVLLISAMQAANKRRMILMSQGRKGESEREQETNRTTGMLLAIVALFLITELPQGILFLCSTFIPDFFGDVMVHLGDLLDIVALINNSINFVLYCTMSRQFRVTFVDVFCGCCPESRPGWLKLTLLHPHEEERTNNTDHTSA